MDHPAVDTIGVIGCAHWFAFIHTDMQSPEEALLFQIKSEDAVVTGRGQVQMIIQLENLVTVFQVATAERALNLEILIIDKQLIAGGDIYFTGKKRDTTQAAVPATAGEIDLTGIPVHHLINAFFSEINQVDSAVAFALL